MHAPKAILPIALLALATLTSAGEVSKEARTVLEKYRFIVDELIHGTSETKAAPLPQYHDKDSERYQQLPELKREDFPEYPLDYEHFPPPPNVKEGEKWQPEWAPDEIFLIDDLVEKRANIFKKRLEIKKLANEMLDEAPMEDYPMSNRHVVWVQAKGYKEEAKRLKEWQEQPMEKFVREGVWKRLHAWFDAMPKVNTVAMCQEQGKVYDEFFNGFKAAVNLNCHINKQERKERSLKLDMLWKPRRILKYCEDKFGKKFSEVSIEASFGY